MVKYWMLLSLNNMYYFQPPMEVILAGPHTLDMNHSPGICDLFLASARNSQCVCLALMQALQDLDGIDDWSIFRPYTNFSCSSVCRAEIEICL